MANEVFRICSGGRPLTVPSDPDDLVAWALAKRKEFSEGRAVPSKPKMAGGEFIDQESDDSLDRPSEEDTQP